MSSTSPVNKKSSMVGARVTGDYLQGMNQELEQLQQAWGRVDSGGRRRRSTLAASVDAGPGGLLRASRDAHATAGGNGGPSSSPAFAGGRGRRSSSSLRSLVAASVDSPLSDLLARGDGAVQLQLPPLPGSPNGSDTGDDVGNSPVLSAPSGEGSWLSSPPKARGSSIGGPRGGRRGATSPVAALIQSFETGRLAAALAETKLGSPAVSPPAVAARPAQRKLSVTPPFQFDAQRRVSSFGGAPCKSPPGAGATPDFATPGSDDASTPTLLTTPSKGWSIAAHHSGRTSPAPPQPHRLPLLQREEEKEQQQLDNREVQEAIEAAALPPPPAAAPQPTRIPTPPLHVPTLEALEGLRFGSGQQQQQRASPKSGIPSPLDLSPRPLSAPTTGRADGTPSEARPGLPRDLSPRLSLVAAAAASAPASPRVSSAAAAAASAIPTVRAAVRRSPRGSIPCAPAPSLPSTNGSATAALGAQPQRQREQQHQQDEAAAAAVVGAGATPPSAMAAAAVDDDCDVLCSDDGGDADVSSGAHSGSSGDGGYCIVEQPLQRKQQQPGQQHASGGAQPTVQAATAEEAKRAGNSCHNGGGGAASLRQKQPPGPDRAAPAAAAAAAEADGRPGEDGGSGFRRPERNGSGASALGAKLSRAVSSWLGKSKSATRLGPDATGGSPAAQQPQRELIEFDDGELLLYEGDDIEGTTDASRGVCHTPMGAAPGRGSLQHDLGLSPLGEVDATPARWSPKSAMSAPLTNASLWSHPLTSLSPGGDSLPSEADRSLPPSVPSSPPLAVIKATMQQQQSRLHHRQGGSEPDVAAAAGATTALLAPASAAALLESSRGSDGSMEGVDPGLAIAAAAARESRGPHQQPQQQQASPLGNAVGEPVPACSPKVGPALRPTSKQSGGGATAAPRSSLLDKLNAVASHRQLQHQHPGATGDAAAGAAGLQQGRTSVTSLASEGVDVGSSGEGSWKIAAIRSPTPEDAGRGGFGRSSDDGGAAAANDDAPAQPFGAQSAGAAAGAAASRSQLQGSGDQRTLSNLLSSDGVRRTDTSASSTSGGASSRTAALEALKARARVRQLEALSRALAGAGTGAQQAGNGGSNSGDGGMSLMATAAASRRSKSAGPPSAAAAETGRGRQQQQQGGMGQSPGLRSRSAAPAFRRPAPLAGISGGGGGAGGGSGSLPRSPAPRSGNGSGGGFGASPVAGSPSPFRGSSLPRSPPRSISLQRSPVRSPGGRTPRSPSPFRGSSSLPRSPPRGFGRQGGSPPRRAMTPRSPPAGGNRTPRSPPRGSSLPRSPMLSKLNLQRSPMAANPTTATSPSHPSPQGGGSPLLRSPPRGSSLPRSPARTAPPPAAAVPSAKGAGRGGAAGGGVVVPPLRIIGGTPRVAARTTPRRVTVAVTPRSTLRSSVSPKRAVRSEARAGSSQAAASSSGGGGGGSSATPASEPPRFLRRKSTSFPVKNKVDWSSIKPRTDSRLNPDLIPRNAGQGTRSAPLSSTSSTASKLARPHGSSSGGGGGGGSGASGGRAATPRSAAGMAGTPRGSTMKRVGSAGGGHAGPFFQTPVRYPSSAPRDAGRRSSAGAAHSSGQRLGSGTGRRAATAGSSGGKTRGPDTAMQRQQQQAGGPLGDIVGQMSGLLDQMNGILDRR